MAKRDALFINAGSGSLPSYDANELRQMLDLFQAGVIGAGDFKVTAGSGLALSSAAGRALVTPSGSGVPTFPGRYAISDDAAEGSATWENGPIPANPGANPRLDAVVLHVFDAGFSGSRREWVREYVPGVAASGAALGGTLPTLPDSSLLLAEVLIPANATTATAIPAGNIRDRRRWARGAYDLVSRTSNAGGTNDYTTSSTSLVAIDSTNLNRRIECSGAPLRVHLRSSAYASAGQHMASGLMLDGVVVDAGPPFYLDQYDTATVFSTSWDIVPAAGSHLIAPAWRVSGGTGRLHARADSKLQLVIEEIVRQNSSNG